MTSHTLPTNTSKVINLHQNIKPLIADLLPPEHMSLRLKRIKFIQGQGAVIYDDTFAVEMYIPSGRESATYFGVHRHHGNVSQLHDYFLKPSVLHINDPKTSQLMKKQFDEAVLQFMPLAIDEAGWIVPDPICQRKEAKEIVMNNNLSGAA